MKRDSWPVGPYAVRPAGKPDECFFCHRKLGQEHGACCVCRKKTIVVEMTLRVVRSVPEDWDEGDITSHLEAGRACGTNIVQELRNLQARMLKANRHTHSSPDCMCDFVSCKYLRGATAEDEEWQVLKVAELKS